MGQCVQTGVINPNIPIAIDHLDRGIYTLHMDGMVLRFIKE
jgi:hypothetical protein